MEFFDVNDMVVRSTSGSQGRFNQFEEEKKSKLTSSFTIQVHLANMHN